MADHTSSPSCGDSLFTATDVEDDVMLFIDDTEEDTPLTGHSSTVGIIGNTGHENSGNRYNDAEDLDDDENHQYASKSGVKLLIERAMDGRLGPIRALRELLSKSTIYFIIALCVFVLLYHAMNGLHREGAHSTPTPKPPQSNDDDYDEIPHLYDDNPGNYHDLEEQYDYPPDLDDPPLDLDDQYDTPPDGDSSDPVIADEIRQVPGINIDHRANDEINTQHPIGTDPIDTNPIDTDPVPMDDNPLDKDNTEQPPPPAAAQPVPRNQHIDEQLLMKQEYIRTMTLHAWESYQKRCMGADEIKPMTGDCSNWDNLQLHANVIDSLSTFMVMGLDRQIHDVEEYLRSQITTPDYFVEMHRSVHVFETTIRILGGLLSAHELSEGDDNDDYLYYATLLANALLPAFDTPTGLPFTNINLHTGVGTNPSWTNGRIVLADAGTLSMEFCALSSILNERFPSDRGLPGRFKSIMQKDTSIYCQKTLAATAYLDQLTRTNRVSQKSGLLPLFISTQVENSYQGVSSQQYSIGPMADSYYEYLLKTWVLTGKVNHQLKASYLSSIAAIMKLMYVEIPPNSPDPAKLPQVPQDVFTFLAEKPIGYVGDISYTLPMRETRDNDDDGDARDDADAEPNIYRHYRMNHLACFFPGVLALGVHHGIVQGQEAVQHMEWAEILTATCSRGYLFNPVTGLAPEVYSFDRTSMVHDHSKGSSTYNLRPETIESLYIVYKITKNHIYREIAWLIAQNIEKYTKVKYGYSNIEDVFTLPKSEHLYPNEYNPAMDSPDSSPSITPNQPQTTRSFHPLANRQETFLLAETFKYLYLLFEDDNNPSIDLDQFVFTTEGHPLRPRQFSFMV